MKPVFPVNEMFPLDCLYPKARAAADENFKNKEFEATAPFYYQARYFLFILRETDEKVPKQILEILSDESVVREYVFQF
jgi:hypothetical protein